MAITTIKDINLSPAILAKVNAAIPDAPSDGKQYARKDGAWEEVSGGGGSFIPLAQVTVGSGGDYTDLDALMAWADGVAGNRLEVELVSNVDTPTGGAFINKTFAKVAIKSSGYQIGASATGIDCVAVEFSDKLKCGAGITINNVSQANMLEIDAYSATIMSDYVKLPQIKTNCALYVYGAFYTPEITAGGDVALSGSISVYNLYTKNGGQLTAVGSITITNMQNADSSSSAGTVVSYQTGFLSIKALAGYDSGKYSGTAPSGRSVNTIDSFGLIIATP